MKEDLGLDYAFSNVLHEEDGKLTGEVSGPLVTGSKAEILKEIMEMEKLKAEESAAVGDGANDVSMLEEAGLGIAFNAKPVLKEKADVVIEKRDLREVLEVFNEDETSNDTTEEKAPEETNKENKKEVVLKESKEPEKDDTGITEETPSELLKEEIPAKESSPDVKAEVKPETNPDAGKSFGELLSNKKELEKRLKILTKERDDLNEDAREFKKIRDELNASIKENLDKALKYRDERDKINQEVRKYKKLRDETNQELKKMEYASGRRDILKIQSEIDKIEKTIETKVLDMRKENELVKKVQDLSKTLSQMKEDEKVQTEAVALKEVSEAHHAKVVEFSDKAQETHEKMLEYFKNIDDVRTKADLAHNQFIETREKASAKHEEVKSVLNEIRRKNKGLDKVKAKERNIESEKSKKKNMAEKEIAKDIYEKFKEGKKLSTEELRLLQKHNIV
jgi:phosphoserine phosphatase